MKFHPLASPESRNWKSGGWSNFVLPCGAKLHKPREMASWNVEELSLPELSGLSMCQKCLEIAEAAFGPENGEGEPLLDKQRWLYILTEGQQGLDLEG